MKIEKDIDVVEIDKLIPYHNNPKEHPQEQIDKIASSIKNYGFTQPIVIDADNEIIIGHGRLEAAKKLGMDKIPAIKRNDLTEKQIKALRIADNKVAESEWDMEALEVEFEVVEDEFTGFDEIEIEGVIEDINIDDFFKDVEENDDEKNETKTVKCPECGEVIEI